MPPDAYIIAPTRAGQQRFLYENPAAPSRRELEERCPRCPRSVSSAAAILRRVISGPASTSPTRKSPNAASAPDPGGLPCRAGSTDPLASALCASLTAKLALTPNRDAASRRCGPPRCDEEHDPSDRKNTLCPCDPPPVMANHKPTPLEILHDSHFTQTALDAQNIGSCYNPSTCMPFSANHVLRDLQSGRCCSTFIQKAAEWSGHRL
jgi:hypothetical protein